MKCKEPDGMQSGAKSAWKVIWQLSFAKQQSTYFASLEIHSWFHSWAVLCWHCGSLGNTRKCQFEDLDKKWYDLRLPNGRLHKRPLQRKADQGKKPVLILVPGSHEQLTSRKRLMCSRNMGAHVRRGIRSTKGVWSWPPVEGSCPLMRYQLQGELTPLMPAT